ncbi:MAG: CBS domain-containing protein, partial [Chloroflexi bacterium]|nr:CBS domain-containing protein [Chloroflexota bacterium]
MDQEKHIRALQELNDAENPEVLAVKARSMHAADLASLLEEMDAPRRHAIFACLDNASAAALLDELEPDLRAELLAPLSLDRASDIVEEMPADEAADLLNELPEARADAILGAMETDDADDVRELLDYESDTAGGQMTTEFIAVDESLTVDETIRRLQELAPEAETIYYLYVLGEDDRLVGVVSLRSLIISDPQARVSDIMSRRVISIGADADQEEAAELIARYNLVAVPVLDEAGRPIGIITVDDAVDVIDEETSEDFYELAGSGEESDHPEGIAAAVRRRFARWVGTLVVSLLAGAMLGWICVAAPSPG